MYLSPSELSLHTICPKRWKYRYIDGMRDEGPEAEARKARGIEVHRMMDLAASGHDVKDVDPIVRSMGPIWERMRHLSLREHQVVWWDGTLPIPIGGYIDVLVPGDVPLICDYKTTSRKPKRGLARLSQSTLAKDIQALVYAWSVLERYGGNGVDLMWVYINERDFTDVAVVSTSMTRGEVLHAFTSVVHPRVDDWYVDMRALNATKKHLWACSFCPYVKRCLADSESEGPIL